MAQVMKKEADGEHPSSHYLVVGDPNKVTTWHLLFKNPDGSINRRYLGAAWAALHKGHRGNVYAGPGKAEAIARLQKLYKSEGMSVPGKSEEMAAVVGAIAYLEAKKALSRSEWTEVLDAGLKDGDWHLEVLGAPYGGHLGGKDAQGQYFSPRTSFGMDPGETRPVYYYHGDTPEGQRAAVPEIIGKAKATRRDSKGLWFDVVLDKSKALAKRVYEAATRGLARASSGAANYLTRYGEDGEILSWPITELTLLDVGGGRAPANDLARVSAKSLFDHTEDEPEAPEEAE